MKLSIVVPIFNEKNTIKEIYDSIRAVDVNKEIILVDDCSTEITSKISKMNVRISEMGISSSATSYATCSTR